MSRPLAQRGRATAYTKPHFVVSFGDPDGRSGPREFSCRLAVVGPVTVAGGDDCPFDAVLEHLRARGGGSYLGAEAALYYEDKRVFDWDDFPTGAELQWGRP